MNMMAHMSLPPRSTADSGTFGMRNMAALALAGTAMLVMAYAAWNGYSVNPPANLPVTTDALDQQVQQLKALPAGELAAAMAAQQQRLAADPLDRTALQNLAQIRAAEGNAAASENLVLEASGRSLRDFRVQAATLEILLRRGDVAKALMVMDALARARPQLQETLFKQLMALAATPEGKLHVESLLATAPPWRTAFFDQHVRSGTAPQLIYSLFAALKGSENPATEVEIRLLLGQLVKEKQYATAYFIWLDLLDELDLRRVAPVFDSGFETTPRNLYFGWTLGRSRTVDVRIVPRATGSADKVLRVDYIGNREAITAVYQYLRLAPGDYVLSGEQRADGLQTENGILWRIICKEGSGSTLAVAPRLSGDAQWTRFDVRFSVPENCPTQMLYLFPSSSAALDQQVSGSAQFDNIAVTPLSASP